MLACCSLSTQRFKFLGISIIHVVSQLFYSFGPHICESLTLRVSAGTSCIPLAHPGSFSFPCIPFQFNAVHAIYQRCGSFWKYAHEKAMVAVLWVPQSTGETAGDSASSVQCVEAADDWGVASRAAFAPGLHKQQPCLVLSFSGFRRSFSLGGRQRDSTATQHCLDTILK